MTGYVTVRINGALLTHMSNRTLYFRNWESTVWKRPWLRLQNPIDMKAV